MIASRSRNRTSQLREAAKQRRLAYHEANPIPRLPPPEVILVEGTDVRHPDFLKTYAWRELRYKALRETRGHCECCGAGPQHGVRLNVDHILPRKSRPDLALDPFNLQVLCDDCNAGKGSWDQSDWR